MSAISMITLALGGVFGLIGWILALVALNYRFEVLGIVAQPSIWTQAVDYNGMSASFLAAASFVFIISITAWLPGFLSFAGAAMAHKEPSRARPFGAALGCIYMLYMLLAVLYFVYHVDRHLDGIGPSITNPMPDAQMLACVFMFLPAGMLSLIGGCAAADKPEEAKEPQPAVASQVPPV